VEDGVLTLSGFVASVDGTQYIRETISGEVGKGAELGVQMAEKLIERGAGQILNQIKSTNNTH
jgi:hydroxymethylbilane synthase